MHAQAALVHRRRGGCMAECHLKRYPPPHCNPSVPARPCGPLALNPFGSAGGAGGRRELDRAAPAACRRSDCRARPPPRCPDTHSHPLLTCNPSAIHPGRSTLCPQHTLPGQFQDGSQTPLHRVANTFSDLGGASSWPGACTSPRALGSGTRGGLARAPPRAVLHPCMPIACGRGAPLP